VADIRSSEAAAAIWGAEAVAHERGYALLVANARLHGATGVRHLRSLLERRIDGLLCSSVVPIETVYDFVQRTGVPAVIYGRFAPSELLPTTVLSYASATEEAVDHLVGLGHRHIGTITRTTEGGVDDRMGTLLPYIHHLLRVRGVATNGELDRAASSPAECSRLVHELLTGSRRPTALFVTSLYLIPATLAAIRDAGWRVPRDVSVVGYGDPDWVQLVEPPLSAIVVDYAAHLEAAASLLVGLIEGDSPTALIEHHSQYIRRGSVQPPHSPAD
jgi:DNA-binding LacI/PurR family transcriptional regulator